MKTLIAILTFFTTTVHGQDGIQYLSPYDYQQQIRDSEMRAYENEWSNRISDDYDQRRAESRERINRMIDETNQSVLESKIRDSLSR